MLSNLEWTFDDPRDLRFLEYDLADESDIPANPAPKRQRADPSALDGLAAKINAIKPSLSRKWKSRKASPTVPLSGASREPSLSRANSTRAPSFSSVTIESNKAHPYPLPPTPTKSALEESIEEVYGEFLDDPSHPVEESETDHMENQAKPTTPLLPPLMTASIPDHLKEVPYQSPLQSPSVAGPDFPSAHCSPMSTPQVTSLPSPPLSTRPSTASFQRHHSQRGQQVSAPLNSPQIVPSTEIPPYLLDTPQDEWTDALGHANFHIFPEPYCPAHPTARSCKQLRKDWSTASKAFRAHLSYVQEHYGPTSRTYLMTEEKWATIDAIWKRNMDACIAAEAISGGEEAEEDYDLHDRAYPGEQMDIKYQSSPQMLVVESTAARLSNSRSPSTSNPSPVANPLTPKTDSPSSPSPGLPASALPGQASPSIPQPSRSRAVSAPKRPAKFPSPGENGIVGPMEVVASRRVLDAQLDKSEAIGGDLSSPGLLRTHVTATIPAGTVTPTTNVSGRRKRKWGSVFTFRWMMEKLSGGESGLKAGRA